MKAYRKRRDKNPEPADVEVHNANFAPVDGHLIQARDIHGDLHVYGRQPTIEGLYRTGAILERAIEDYDPIRDLGVHPPSPLPDGPPLPPYVPRKVDAELDRALADGGLVVLEGKSAAGKTRTAWEAVRRAARGSGRRRMLVPRDGAALRVRIESGPPLRETVVWLNDLERFLAPDGLDNGMLAALCPPGRTDILLLATLRSEARSQLGIEGRPAQVTHSAQHLLAAARTIRLDRQLDPAESRTARRHGADPRIASALDDRTGAGLAEHLAAAPAVLNYWQSGQDGLHELGAALVSAAVDCRRAGYFMPVPRTWLVQLCPAYLEPRVRNRLDEPDFDDAFRWATTPVHGASSCLQPEADDRLAVFDYLVDQTQADAESSPIPEDTWQALFDLVPDQDPGLFRIAVTALRAGRDTATGEIQRAISNRNPAALLEVGAAYFFGARMTDNRTMLNHALTMWVIAAEDGSPEAMYNLGHVLATAGQWEEAENWWRSAADAGSGWAMGRLGDLCHDRGTTAEAQSWWQRAAEHGDSEAMLTLGKLAYKRNDIDAAEQWCARAGEAGSVQALYNLADLARQRGDRAEAESRYRAAAEAGHPTALDHMLESARRRHDQTEIDYWRQRRRRATKKLRENLDQRLLEEGHPDLLPLLDEFFRDEQ